MRYKLPTRAGRAWVARFVIFTIGHRDAGAAAAAAALGESIRTGCCSSYGTKIIAICWSSRSRLFAAIIRPPGGAFGWLEVGTGDASSYFSICQCGSSGGGLSLWPSACECFGNDTINWVWLTKFLDALVVTVTYPYRTHSDSILWFFGWRHESRNQRLRVLATPQHTHSRKHNWEHAACCRWVKQPIQHGDVDINCI